MGTDEELEHLAREGGALRERGPEVNRRAPIGALPLSSERPPRDRFSELTDDAQRYTRMIRDAVKDIATASFRLARLPAEAALLAARRLRPARG